MTKIEKLEDILTMQPNDKVEYKGYIIRGCCLDLGMYLDPDELGGWEVHDMHRVFLLYTGDYRIINFFFNLINEANEPAAPARQLKNDAPNEDLPDLGTGEPSRYVTRITEGETDPYEK